MLRIVTLTVFLTIICILIRKKTLSSCFMRYPADLNKQKSCDLVVRNIQTLSWVFQEITSSFSFISWNNKPKRDQIYLLFFLNLIYYLNKILSFWSSKQMLRFKVSKIPPVKGHDYHWCILVDWYISKYNKYASKYTYKCHTVWVLIFDLIFCVLYATFKHCCWAILWCQFLLLEEAEVPGENHDLR